MIWILAVCLYLICGIVVARLIWAKQWITEDDTFFGDILLGLCVFLWILPIVIYGPMYLIGRAIKH